MNKLVFWTLTFLIFSALIYAVSETLAPFIIAFIFAYLLQPLIDNNSKRFNAPRGLISTGIFSIFISSFIVILVVLLPIIYNQIAAFITKIPSYKNNFNVGLDYFLAWIQKFDPAIAAKVSDSLQNFINSAFSVVVAAANNI